MVNFPYEGIAIFFWFCILYIYFIFLNKYITSLCIIYELDVL